MVLDRDRQRAPLAQALRADLVQRSMQRAIGQNIADRVIHFAAFLVDFANALEVMRGEAPTLRLLDQLAVPCLHGNLALFEHLCPDLRGDVDGGRYRGALHQRDMRAHPCRNTRSTCCKSTPVPSPKQTCEKLSA